MTCTNSKLVSFETGETSKEGQLTGMLLLVTTCFLIFTSPQYIRYIIFANYPILKDVETFAKVALLYQCTQKSFFTNRYFYIHFSFTNLQHLQLLLLAKVVAKVMFSLVFVFSFIPLYRALVPSVLGPPQAFSKLSKLDLTV